MRCYFNVRSKADNKSLMEAGCHAKRAWSLANTECAMFWYDALTRTETVELRERSSQVDDSRRHRFANATHDNRNTSWLDASRHRSNNIQTSSDIQSTYTHTHTRLTALFPVPERQNQSGFYWSKRQWVAVSSAGPYASLHLAPDR